jgi:hypothetical protein
MFDDDFYKVIGDVLTDILEQQMKEDALQYVNTDD